jgi:hypothetical protein
MKKQKKRRRFTISTIQRSPAQRTIEMEPEELTAYVRLAKHKVIAIIRGWHLCPRTVKSLPRSRPINLSLQISVSPLIVGWPSPITSQYTGQRETLCQGWCSPTSCKRSKRRPTSKAELSGMFPAIHFSKKRDTTRLGRSSWWNRQHPEARLCQIWMRTDGPSTFFTVYRDSVKRENRLEAIITVSRKGGIDTKIVAHYGQVKSQANAERKQMLSEKMISHMKLTYHGEKPLPILTECGVGIYHSMRRIIY